MTALVPPARFESKILDPSQLEDFAKLCPRPLVFTNGVYDLVFIPGADTITVLSELSASASQEVRQVMWLH